MQKIKICDRTLCRSGADFGFKEKLEIARQLNRLKVDAIELPAIENPRADALLIKAIASFAREPVLSVNAGITKESIASTAAALATAEKPELRIELPVSTVGMEYTCHKKADKMAATVNELVAYAKGMVPTVEFYAIDATRADPAELEAIIKAALGAGADKITLCDTAAEMLPEDFGAFVKAAAEKFDTEICVCCNNKNGLAAANTVTAVKNGAACFKASADGEGAPLSTVTAAMKNCAEAAGFELGIKYTEVKRIISQISRITGKSEAPATTAATDGDFMDFGADDSRESVMTAVLRLGYDLSDEDCDRVYEEFLRVAAKKNVGEKELDAIVASVALQVPASYKLVSYVINNGNIISSSAQMTLERDGKPLSGIAMGDGPVASAFAAIEQITGKHYELDDFQIHSVTEGKQALGTALVKLRSEGRLYSGNGISTDIIEAGIKAYLSAVNKIVYEEENA